MLADALTKVMDSSLLRKVMKEGVYQIFDEGDNSNYLSLSSNMSGMFVTFVLLLNEVTFIVRTISVFHLVEISFLRHLGTHRIHPNLVIKEEKRFTHIL